MTVATGAATLSTFGLNTSFAIKRWPEPERWAALTRQIGVDLMQFSFDLLDPWWPATLGGLRGGGPDPKQRLPGPHRIQLQRDAAPGP